MFNPFKFLRNTLSYTKFSSASLGAFGFFGNRIDDTVCLYNLYSHMTEFEFNRNYTSLEIIAGTGLSLSLNFLLANFLSKAPGSSGGSQIRPQQFNHALKFSSVYISLMAKELEELITRTGLADDPHITMQVSFS